MTNEKDTERRKDILAMAKCVNHARAGWEKYDLSDFALGDVSREGMLNVAIAAYLYDIGYRVPVTDDITVIVEGGQVIGVYSYNEDIAAEVIDLDVQDSELLEMYKASADKVRNTQYSIW